jgi:Domain of unknown function (DUF4395)
MERTAHPYRDTDVIDARAPRFNQATIGVVALLAVITGWWPLLTLLAAQLILGLTFGRKFCLPCVFYFEVVQPRIGEGEIEDARPPRFANTVGAAFLTAATVAYLAGLEVVGAVLGLIVATLALLAATTGLCVGCELYRYGARLRGVRHGRVAQIDLDELGAPDVGPLIVQFTHPLCSACHDQLAELSAAGRFVHEVDVSARPDLARKYHVAVVPFAIAVAPDGKVLTTVAS